MSRRGTSTRSAAVGLVLGCLASLSAAAAPTVPATIRQVEPGDQVVLEAQHTSSVLVEVTEPIDFPKDFQALGELPESMHGRIRIDGDAEFAGFALVSPAGQPQRPELLVIRPPENERIHTLLAIGGRANDNSPPELYRGEQIPAGTYRLVVATSGGPVRVSLNLHGSTITNEVRPTMTSDHGGRFEHRTSQAPDLPNAVVATYDVQRAAHAIVFATADIGPRASHYGALCAAADTPEAFRDNAAHACTTGSAALGLGIVPGVNSGQTYSFGALIDSRGPRTFTAGPMLGALGESHPVEAWILWFEKWPATT